MKNKFGKKIQMVREEKSMSRTELAQASGLTEKGLTYIEEGKRIPRLDTFLRIANGLGVSPETILEEIT